MAGTLPSTPLGSLDAVVLDTETTGLDATTARIVEVAAIPIAADVPPFVRLVRPGIPIPAASSSIHGIHDADVTGAPPAAEIPPELERYLAGAVLIGHAISYDLEVLRREAERAGQQWPEHSWIDVRPLARLVAPTLADHSLDALCAWLGIALRNRHRALGDADATARVFAALVPLLRRRGIRTLGGSRKRLPDREAARGARRIPG